MEKRNYLKPHVEESYFLTNKAFLINTSGGLTEEGGTITDEQSIVIDKIHSCYTVGNDLEEFLSDKDCDIWYEYGTYQRTGKVLYECIDFKLLIGTYKIELKKVCNSGMVSGKFTKIN